MDIRVEAAGTVEPIRVVEVKSKASGEILRLTFETGHEVQQGALLAEIDPRDVRNALAQAEADLAVARERLAIAEAQRRRSADLRESSVITAQEFEAAALDEANAQAQLVKARTNLELARERMGDVTIRAPLAGTVIEKNVEVGQIIASASQNISGGTTLLRMADLSAMQVRALVDETDIGRVAPGQTAQVTVEAYQDRRFTGAVLKIEPQAVVEQNVTMFPVLVRLENQERLLKPGMNAEIQVEIARREGVMVVPNAAVVSPRDLMPAAAALGLSEEAVRAALGRGRPDAAAVAGAGAGQSGAQPGGAAASAAGADAGRSGAAPPSTECSRLRDRLRGGGFAQLSEQERALLQKCRSQFGGGGAAGTLGGGPGRGSGLGGSGSGSGGFGGGSFGGGSRPNGDARPGIVFVSTAKGPEPRTVLLGVNDWEYSEVIRGLEPGEKVVLVSVARLQQQQQEFENRIRQRSAGMFQGGGQSGRPANGAAVQRR